MNSKNTIKKSLELSMKHTLAAFEGLEAHGTTYPSTNGGCHPLWTLGHLANSEYGIIRGVMRGEANPLAGWDELFKGGSTPKDDVSAYPSHEELLKACHEAREATITLLESYSEDDLNQESAHTPPGYDVEFGTHRDCFQFTAAHWYMHRGNLADAKRSAGLV